MTIIKKKKANVVKDAKKGGLCWRECKLIQPLWKTVQGFLKKLEKEQHMTHQSYYSTYNQRNGSQCAKGTAALPAYSQQPRYGANIVIDEW
jgi:hypothetical protein